MLVYRICNQDEVLKVLSLDDLSTIGTYGRDFIGYNRSRLINSHDYAPNERYLHFFHEKWGILYWKPKENRAVCTYDIPDEILESTVGLGKYLSAFNYSTQVNVKEYAIRSSQLKSEYLKKVERVKENIDFTDDNYLSDISDCLELVYEREKDLRKSFSILNVTKTG